jgi:hypothetical protein
MSRFRKLSQTIWHANYVQLHIIGNMYSGILCWVGQGISEQYKILFLFYAHNIQNKPQWRQWLAPTQSFKKRRLVMNETNVLESAFHGELEAVIKNAIKQLEKLGYRPITVQNYSRTWKEFSLFAMENSCS